jgi:hypothetical protein
MYLIAKRYGTGIVLKVGLTLIVFIRWVFDEVHHGVRVLEAHGSS